MDKSNKNTTPALCGGGLGRDGNSLVAKLVKAISGYGEPRLFFQKHVILDIYLVFTQLENMLKKYSNLQLRESPEH